MPTRYRKLPSAAIVHYWLDYDQFTGRFAWRRSPTARIKIGDEAGTVNKRGYRWIGIRGFEQMAAHHLAWIYAMSQIPDGLEVDHIDCDPGNNAITNLRLATSSQQKRNKRVQSNNRSGLKGAYFHALHKGKKWRSQIKVGDKLIFLGYFNTPEEAHIAYAEAAKEHFGEFARAA